SSREHAAMSPRWLGAGAIIVRSFARIHESNLKKQGVLPLVFVDPADYAKVREDDEITLESVLDIAPGKPVTAVLHHQGGAEERISLKHSCNAEQIEWFKAGAALNLLRARGS
ncbi:MAG TPA: aconitate hydratase, partial [Candidatus Binatia bacterium]|nr:aconitate hydratase [Candidatus Binatia bacterium]